MALALISLLFGLLLLYFGGELLVRGAASLALQVGLTPLAVGLTVVAFGTSAPELAVSLDASLDGLGDVAMGNIVGSNISNVGLILGLTACLQPMVVHKQVLRFDLPMLTLVSVATLFLFLDQTFDRPEGIGLTIGLALYLAIVLTLSRRENRGLQSEFAASLAEEVPQPHGKPLLNLFLVAIGIGMLVLGGDRFVYGSTTLARMLGISEALIALTLVAFGTSLPELATSLVAAMRGHGDIAVGNIVGSNLFNLLCIAGVTSTIKPFQAPGVTLFDFAVMITFTIGLFPLMGLRHRLTRGGGALLLTCYVGYIGFIASRG